MSASKCTMCSKTASLLCLKCKSSSYCSSDCLSKDAPSHKFLCSQYVKFISTNPRPGDELIETKEARADRMNTSVKQSTVVRLGLILAANSKSPRYAWVTFHQTIYGTNIDENVDEFDTISAGRIEIPQEDSIIELWFQEKVGYGTKKDFRTVSSLGDFNKRDRKTPILALRYRYNVSTAESFGGVYQDMTPSDCHFAQTWLATNSPHVLEPYSEPSNSEVETFSSPNEVQGVIINCLGFQKLLNKPKYVEIKISPTDKIFKSGTSSEISAHLQIPLLLKKCRSPPSFAQNSHVNPYKNHEAHFLLMGADPSNEKEWRSADFGTVGSVLVVRKNGKDVSAQQVEALVRFCRDGLLRGMIEVDGKGEEARAEFVREQMCREKFEEFFEAMKNRRILKGDKSWENTFSPYSV